MMCLRSGALLKSWRRLRASGGMTFMKRIQNIDRGAARCDKCAAAPFGDPTMPADALTRTDTGHIGKTIKELVRLMIEEGATWQNAADAVGLKRTRAYYALHKPHVITYRRQEKAKFAELLSTRVPRRLNELMDSENAAAAVRAALSLEDMTRQSRAEPTRRIQTGGIVIVLGAPTQQALPVESAMPVLEAEPVDE
jgi:hypothetical protein